MRYRTGPAIAAALALAAPAGALAQPAEHPLLSRLAAEVSEARLQAIDATLVGFGTRHTLSTTTAPTRGIGAARAWTAAQFQALSDACAGCLTIDTPAQTFTGERIPTPTAVVDVLAVQRGTTDPDRVIVISAHIDSLMSDYLDGKSDAPGADDDGSGVAAVLEAARILSARKFPATLVYAVLSGEEQGLYGGKVLADYAAAHHWRVEGDLNNDIIGNIHGQSGLVDNSHVRVFSEGARTNETPAQARARRDRGGDSDSPSRNLARFIAAVAEPHLTDLEVKQIYRPDRFHRGGDELEMLNQGYPAVRLTEPAENYDRQHQRVRVENGVQYGDLLEGVDFPYLAKVTRLNVIALAALALAPEPVRDVGLEGAVAPDTIVRWAPADGARAYRVWWRDTTEPRWTHSRLVDHGLELKLAGLNIDDWIFGVSAIGPDGYESPIAVPGISGSFDRLPPSGPTPEFLTPGK